MEAYAERGVFFFYHRHAQGFVIHAEKPEPIPIPHTVNCKLEIRLAISVVCSQAVQIGIDFLG